VFSDSTLGDILSLPIPSRSRKDGLQTLKHVAAFATCVLTVYYVMQAKEHSNSIGKVLHIVNDDTVTVVI